MATFLVQVVLHIWCRGHLVIVNFNTTSVLLLRKFLKFAHIRIFLAYLIHIILNVVRLKNTVSPAELIVQVRVKEMVKHFACSYLAPLADAPCTKMGSFVVLYIWTLS